LDQRLKEKEKKSKMRIIIKNPKACLIAMMELESKGEGLMTILHKQIYY
jgi:hypothetical protein